MTTRAEEIAGDGPYRVEKSSGVYVIMGPHGRWPFHFSHESTAKGRADDFNKVYKQGQQDRWIPVSERMPEDKVNVLVAGYSYNRPGADYWQRKAARYQDCWVEDAEDVGYWEGHPPTHWMPLPAPPSPPNPEQR